MRNVNTLLFDLGGVLIELGTVDEMMGTSPKTKDAIWSGWIRSSAVRSFESGCSSLDQFAIDMINEFQLSISAAEFIAAFRAWPKGTFEGALELLQLLSGHYRLACLSNTNPAHYESFLKEEAIMELFDHIFLSHQTGKLKPDEAAFMNVVQHLEVNPNQILFFDDHPANVAAAKALGLHAECVNAPSSVADTLKGLGLHEHAAEPVGRHTVGRLAFDDDPDFLRGGKLPGLPVELHAAELERPGPGVQDHLIRRRRHRRDVRQLGG